MNVENLTVPELLVLHTQIADELRERGITRSANNPTGDLSEYLFCKAFGWNQASNSHANVDAVSTDGTRFQIKAVASRAITVPGSCLLFATSTADISISLPVSGQVCGTYQQPQVPAAR